MDDGSGLPVFGIKLLVTDEEHHDTEISPWKHRIALTTFFMVTAAEWGDASQIEPAALVAHLHAPVQVVTGATLGYGPDRPLRSA